MCTTKNIVGGGICSKTNYDVRHLNIIGKFSQICLNNVLFQL